ncbi:NADH-quinone oxidoreductase [Irpex rosettiformis]|uniref:NADH-quinone oxidoreductase n=1 Tax=Irpex rosettiformis TaxID=378272 RepID=A0ACB8UE17_9APHY|nr:NADH-quinone oxidoreductase [Irpex rosettiformis]
MVFCLPCKSLGKYFNEDNEPPKPKPESNGKKAEAKSELAAQPASTTAAVETKEGPKVAIIIYSMYGHIAGLAEAVKGGVEKAGGKAAIYQVPETLSQELLDQLHAPPKPAYPVIQPDDLVKFDAFILGIPTRFGNYPYQWKSFWDATGGLWAEGALAGKYASVFVSTGSQGGGQETTVSSAISTLAHHGILYVPFGYSRAFPQLTSFESVHGGSPWGAGTVAGADGSRQPSPLELEIGGLQGQQFYDIIKKVAH